MSWHAEYARFRLSTGCDPWRSAKTPKGVPVHDSIHNARVTTNRLKGYYDALPVYLVEASEAFVLCRAIRNIPDIPGAELGFLALDLYARSCVLERSHCGVDHSGLFAHCPSLAHGHPRPIRPSPA